MALQFANGIIEYVNWPAHASINDLDPQTWACWTRVSSHGGNRGFMQKQTTGGRMRLVSDGTGGNVKYLVFQSSVGCSYTTNDTPMATLDKWYFILGTYSQSDTPRMRIFVGDLTTLAVESSYSGGGDDGSGTKRADNANDLTVGTRNETDTAGTLSGEIAWCGVFNDFFTVEMARQIQFRTRPIGTCGLFCHLGLNDGTGTQRDWSGNGNVGTITGAGVTAERHPPVPFPLWLPRRSHLLVEAAAYDPSQLGWQTYDRRVELPKPEMVSYG